MILNADDEDALDVIRNEWTTNVMAKDDVEWWMVEKMMSMSTKNGGMRKISRMI